MTLHVQRSMFMVCLAMLGLPLSGQAQTIAQGAEVAAGAHFVKHHPFLSAMGAAVVGGVLVHEARVASRGTAFDPNESNDNASIMAKSASAELTENMEGALDENQERIDQDKESGCEAHHIVMASSGNVDVVKSRAILQSCHIDINSFHNGVYLPRFKKGSLSTQLPLLCRHAADHSTLHTDIYKNKVFMRLSKAYTMDVLDFQSKGVNQGHCGHVIEALRKMKFELELGGLK